MHADPPGQTTLGHQAMATTFSITIAHGDERYARQAIAEAFQELDRLENRLSAFVEQSDVARIARLQPGQTCVLDPDTYACLEIALAVERETGGAFDIAYRTQPHRPATELIRLSPQVPVVEALGTAVTLDLGGIGKGFALDRMAELLADWDLHCVLLRASKSTLLAGEAPPGSRGWEVQFGTPTDPRKLVLSRSALSGSGTDLKGPHIIDPATGQPATAPPTGLRSGTYRCRSRCAVHGVSRDDRPAIQDYCRHDPLVAAYVVPAQEDSLRTLHASHTEAPSLSFQ